MRLIDAEQLKQAVRKKFPTLVDRCEINELVNAAPAVEVVRCGECKYWYAEIGASTGWLLARLPVYPIPCYGKNRRGFRCITARYTTFDIIGLYSPGRGYYPIAL